MSTVLPGAGWVAMADRLSAVVHPPLPRLRVPARPSAPRTLGAVSLSFRSRVEHSAHPLLERLNRLPAVVPFLVALALLATGVFVPRWGFLATAVVTVVVGFLVYYTWPRLSLPEKLMRLAVLLLVAAVTAVQALPRA